MRCRSRSFILLITAFALFATTAVWQATQPPADPPLTRNGPPRYWKGNLHTHSFWSDGDDFPEMIADWYKRHGYDFLALTDHNILAEGQKWIDVPPAHATRPLAFKKYVARFGDGWVEERIVKDKDGKDKKQVRLKPLAEYRSLLEEPGKFLLLSGEEITHRYAKAPVHMNAINLRDLVTPADGGNVRETIQVNHRLVAEQKKRTGWRILAFLNHPNFGWGIRAEDMIFAEEMRHFEIFNGHPSVRNYGDDLHPSCEKMWDIVLALRLGKHNLPIVYGLATDDAHGYHTYGLGKVNPGRGWTMVRAPYLTAEALVKALEAGDFYASSGVRLKDVRRNGGTYSLTIEPEKGVTYRTEFIATMKDAPLASKPRRDERGDIVPVTEIYSDDVGKMVAVSEDLQPSYRLTGQELYVRARVLSSKPHPNPYEKGDKEAAWTQPVVP
ncbi:MAG: hypothetical protein L0Y72_31560 [Gemmataceae bacterium]|nr:hypothetical protein [Gemmataceae bacterium]MCI0743590.1 hypothetical protein [Gemmataceae bacterium]